MDDGVTVNFLILRYFALFPLLWEFLLTKLEDPMKYEAYMEKVVLAECALESFNLGL